MNTWTTDITSESTDERRVRRSTVHCTSQGNSAV